MADVELLPCPFCGSAPRFDSGHGDAVCVLCGECGASSDFWSAGHEAAAASAWNTRANLAPLQAENERLQAEVDRLNAELVRLEKIAGYGGLASDAPERMILASEVYDGMQSCDKWCEVRRVIDDGQPMPESATPYVRADRAERLAEALRMFLAAGVGNSTNFETQFKAVQAARAALAQEDRNG